MAVGTRRSRAVLAAGFSRWFAEHEPTGPAGGEGPEVVVSRPASGLSSETVLLEVADRGGFAARMPPEGSTLFPDYDLRRQARVQTALEGLLPVAHVVAVEDDPAYVGGPFLLMERVDGRTLGTSPPYSTSGWLHEATPEQQAAVLDGFLDVLAATHRLDVGPLNLGETSGGGPTLAGMLRWWTRYLDWATDDRGAAAPYRDALGWLADHLPAQPPAGLLWGDPQLVNLVIADDGSPAAVLDWEMSSTGPAEVDLGWFLALHEMSVEMGGGVDLPGFPDRAGMVAAYCSKLGRDIEDLDWYLAFAHLRSGAIVLRAGQLMREAGLPSDWTSQIAQPRHLRRLTGQD